MTHLTMEQLLELREPGREPGMEAARAHLDDCAACRAEADRLAQRIARLKALPAPRTSRSRFHDIRGNYVRARRGRRLRRVALSGLALAASVALVLTARTALGNGESQLADTNADLESVMARSRELEAALRAYDPDSRVLDGRTAGIAFRIEDQLGAVDRQLQMLNMMQLSGESLTREQVRLWRERVGLLDALVDVHLTRATYAGM